MDSGQESTSSSEKGTSKRKFDIKDKPVCLIVLGMAGSGKTTFVKKLAQNSYKNKLPYLINLDPACKEVPYPVHIGRIYQNISSRQLNSNAKTIFQTSEIQ